MSFLLQFAYFLQRYAFSWRNIAGIDYFHYICVCFISNKYLIEYHEEKSKLTAPYVFYVSQGNLPKVGEAPAPIISTNLAKHQRVESSWSYDSLIMDFANDDDFNTSWVSNPEVKNPWIYVTLGKEQAINMVTITEGNHPHIQEYQLDYRINGEWKPLLDGNQTGRVKIHRFDTIYGDAVRVRIQKANGTIAIAELGIYQERR